MKSRKLYNMTDIVFERHFVEFRIFIVHSIVLLNIINYHEFRRVLYIFFNVLKSFMNDHRVLFSYFSFSTCCRRFSISFFWICVMKYKTWQFLFICIIAKNQISIEFIIEFDIFFANRTETLVRYYVIKERNVLRVKLSYYDI